MSILHALTDADSPFSLTAMNASRWDVGQLWDPLGFRWSVGRSPMSDLQVILCAWVVYGITVVGLKSYMTNRAPFKLKTITAAHNIILCVWSLAMFAGTLWEVIQIASTRGVGEVFCTTDAGNLEGPLYYTMYIYYLSKYYELLDTVILVLKKKPLIFLHWYHHAIVILMVWSWLQYGIVYASLGMMANTLVHVFMYYYYFASSIGQNVWFKRYITSGQIFQFCMAFLFGIPYVYFHVTKGCQGFDAFLFSMAVNGSFLVLFIDFYRRSYLAKKKKAGRTPKTEELKEE